MSTRCWAVPEHTPNVVRRASKIVGKGSGTPRETEEARAVLSNYRMAHAFLLNAVTVTVRKRALEVHSDAVVAQRHKRLPTIDKSKSSLLREPFGAFTRRSPRYP